MNSSNGFLEKKTVDPADKKESDAEANPNKDSDIHERYQTIKQLNHWLSLSLSLTTVAEALTS